MGHGCQLHGHDKPHGTTRGGYTAELTGIRRTQNVKLTKKLTRDNENHTFKTVAEDVFIWAVGPVRSVSPPPAF